MPDYERDFKGIWIPKIIWTDTRLTALDKVILAEIDSLDNGDKGCFASNSYLAEFCQCSETKVSTSISLLINLGYIYVKKFDGRSRELKSCLTNSVRQGYKNCKADSQNFKHINITNNINNNSKKERKTSKETSYDEILSTVTDNSLKELYIEFIKMRKMIKSPMTDRALLMLMKKVVELEPNDVERQKELLETAILHNWKSVYPLTDESDKRTQKSTAMNDLQELHNMFSEEEDND